MSSQIFNRSFLQVLPEQRKQQHIERIIAGFINNLHSVAAVGKTSYMYIPDERSLLNERQGFPVMTNEDVISAFQKKFPECEVSYQETWVDINSNNRVLKKGFIIDWS